MASASVHLFSATCRRIDAAEVLGTTQPNISTRIATLENVLGIVLMHRDAGSVRLTEKGEALLLAARKVLLAGEDFRTSRVPFR